MGGGVNGPGQSTGNQEQAPPDSTVAGNGSGSFAGQNRVNSFVSNGDPADTNNAQDTFIYDRATSTQERVSVAADGSQVAQGGVNPAMSDDGRFVAFISFDPALVPTGSPSAANVFIRDRLGTRSWPGQF